MEHLSAMGIQTLELDVTDLAAIQRAKEKIAALTGGTLDILMNNAGRTYVEAATDLEVEGVRGLFEVNLYSVMNMVKEFMPLLMGSGNGLIMMTGSIAGTSPVPFGAAYNASKAALAPYTDTLRIELAPFNIQVVYLAVGGVKSNISYPKKFPADSLYAPMEEVFQARRMNDHQRRRMDTDEFARDIVAEALKPNPRVWIWAGTMSWVVWACDTFLPVWGWDVLMPRLYGLREGAPMLKAARDKHA